MLALRSIKPVSSCLRMRTWWLQSMIWFSTTTIRWAICERRLSKLSITRLHDSATTRSSRSSYSLLTPFAVFVTTVGDSPPLLAGLTTTSCVRCAVGAMRDWACCHCHLIFVHCNIMCASDCHRHACSCRLIQKRCRHLAQGRGQWPQAFNQNGYGACLLV